MAIVLEAYRKVPWLRTQSGKQARALLRSLFQSQYGDVSEVHRVKLEVVAERKGVVYRSQKGMTSLIVPKDHLM